MRLDLLACVALVASIAHSSHAEEAPSSGEYAGPDGVHQTGDASYYAHRLRGRKTASGERYDPAALTAAHRSLPMGTRLRVTNPRNDRSVVVTVNDRGHLPKGRVVDVSSAAADALDIKQSGVTKVHTQVIGGTRTAQREAANPEAALPH